jgi:hypothetical protein
VFKNWSIHPAKASLIGAIVGGLLLSGIIMFFGWWDRLAHPTGLPDQAWYDGLSFFPALHGVWAGGVAGSMIGISAWIALTRRPVHPLIMSFAWGIISSVTCTILYVLYWQFALPSTGGLQGGLRAQGMGLQYLHVVLPASAVLGVIFGGILGMLKKSQRCHKESSR